MASCFPRFSVLICPHIPLAPLQRQALGLPDFDDRCSPVPVPSLPPVTAIAAASVSAAICGEGRLYLWGSDPYLNPWVQRNRAGGPGSNVMTPRSAVMPVIHRRVGGKPGLGGERARSKVQGQMNR